MKNILAILMNELNISFSNSFMKEILETHSSEQEFQKYSDYLFELGIESMQIKLPKEQLKEIDFPCLALLNNNSTIVITSFKNETIYYINEDHKKKTILFCDFIKTWNGILLLVAKNEQSKELNLKQHKKLDTQNQWKKLGVLVGFIFVGLIPILFLEHSNYSNLNWLFIVKYLGVIVSIFLIQQHIGGSSFIDKICNFNKKVSCNAVLQSKVSKISTWFSLADLSFIYFFGTWLGLIITNSNEENLQIFSILSFASLIPIPYLIFNQLFIIKKWCPLCLTITTLLIFEFIFLKDYMLRDSFNLINVPVIFYGLAISSWFLLLFKKPIQKSIALPHIKKQLNLYTRNPKLIHTLIENGKSIDSSYSIENEVRIGNKAASNHLIVVTDPTCDPCSESHFKIKRLFELFPDDLQITYRFFINNKDNNSPSAIVCKAILEYHERNQNDTTLNIIDSWFRRKNQKDVKGWLSENKLNPENVVNSTNIIDSHIDWCKKNEIQGTPTLILNNKIIPRIIKTEDLKYYLRDL